MTTTHAPPLSVTPTATVAATATATAAVPSTLTSSSTPISSSTTPISSITSTDARPIAAAPTPVRDASSALDLLDRSRQSLLAACQSAVVAERFTQAQLGALRAAAALVAARPTTWRPQGPHSLWELLPTVAPELSEWADFFEVTTPRPRRSPAISSREADDLLRQAETFLDLVCRSLGLPVPRHHGDVLVPTTTPTTPSTG